KQLVASFERARASAKTSIFDIRLEALHGLIFTDGLRGAPIRAGKGDPLARVNAAALVREAYFMDSKVPDNYLNFYFKMSRNGEDWPFARLLSDAEIKAVEGGLRQPDIVIKEYRRLVPLLKLRSEMEQRAEDPYQALVYADRGIASCEAFIKSDAPEKE